MQEVQKEEVEVFLLGGVVVITHHNVNKEQETNMAHLFALAGKFELKIFRHVSVGRTLKTMFDHMQK